MRFYVVEHQDDSVGDGRRRNVFTAKRDAERYESKLRREEREKRRTNDAPDPGASEYWTMEPITIRAIDITGRTGKDRILYALVALCDGAMVGPDDM